MTEPEASTDAFREELRTWLEANCPPSLRPGQKPTKADREAWHTAYTERGYTTPTWPREYGGGGLTKAEARVLAAEVPRFASWAPVASFFGTSMLGPVLLEFGNEAQKQDHLPKITRCEIQWCQGYSEPGSGSDLASLQTRAVLEGEQYVINGSKIWTTGANQADWIFCLTRTDPDAPKHDGISFILFDLRQPGVTISPIQLISGASEFCQVFFEDVKADAKNLVGELNGGWTIAKRLLQHERAMLSGGADGGGGRTRSKKEGPAPAPTSALAEAARPRLGERDGRIADPALRDRIAQYELDALCFGLTLKRSGEQAKAGQGPGPATSMFKLYASEMNKRRSEDPDVRTRAPTGLGWEGAATCSHRSMCMETRGWLRSKGQLHRGRNLGSSAERDRQAGARSPGLTRTVSPPPLPDRSLREETHEPCTDRRTTTHPARRRRVPEGTRTRHAPPRTPRQGGPDRLLQGDLEGHGRTRLDVAFPSPRQVGGAGLGPGGARASILEECGRNLAPYPFLSTVVLGGGVIDLAGNRRPEAGDPAPKRLCKGETLPGPWPVQETGRFSPWAIETRAVAGRRRLPASAARRSSCSTPMWPTTSIVIGPHQRRRVRRAGGNHSLCLVDPPSRRGLCKVDSADDGRLVGRPPSVSLSRRRSRSASDARSLGPVDGGGEILESVFDRAAAALSAETGRTDLSRPSTAPSPT